MLSFIEAVIALGLSALLLSSTLKITSDSLKQISFISKMESKAQKENSWQHSDLSSATCNYFTNVYSQRFALCSKDKERNLHFLLEN